MKQREELVDSGALENERYDVSFIERRKMLTDKEKERFMPKEEAKMRKWASQQRALMELIDETESYYQTESDTVMKTYYLKVKSLLELLKERADAHVEKWKNKAK